MCDEWTGSESNVRILNIVLYVIIVFSSSQYLIYHKLACSVYPSF